MEEMNNLPLTRRHPRLRKFVDAFFRYEGMTITSIGVLAIVGSFIFSLSNYKLLGKLVATITIFAFLLYFVLLPIFVILAIFRADEC